MIKLKVDRNKDGTGYDVNVSIHGTSINLMRESLCLADYFFISLRRRNKRLAELIGGALTMYFNDKTYMKQHERPLFGRFIK